MVPGHPRVLLRMLTPRRHRDPGYAARIAGELYGGSVRDDPALARGLLHATTRLGPSRGYYYQLIASIGWTSLPRLPRLRPPTLILAGDDDPIIPLVNARIMHRLIPHSQLHVYHGGHLELATDAERLAPVVEAFLTAERSRAMTQVTSEHLGESLGTDFFSVREQFTDEQWSHFITVRRFVDEEVVPVVGPYWERAEICWPLVKRLPELGIVGEDIKGYGCAGMSPMACGLVTMELHRGDGSLGVFLGVHAGLAMQSIAMCGSEEQKARWLPDMAQMNKLGAFALTEPEHGSDSVALETSARPVKGMATVGLGAERPQTVDRPGQRGRPGRRLGPQHRGRPGQRVRRGEGIAGLPGPGHRGEGVAALGVAGRNHAGERAGAGREPAARRALFKDTSRVLATTRSTCAWAALGHATSAYDAALRYAQERRQFGEPLASFQIIQQRLVSMLADLTAMQLYCLQIGRLAEAGRLTPTVAGLAKMHNTRKARAIAAEARDMLGGNGILLDYQVMRHMVDLEAIHTFEGTETMQTLIVGRAITGIGAFTRYGRRLQQPPGCFDLGLGGGAAGPGRQTPSPSARSCRP